MLASMASFFHYFVSLLPSARTLAALDFLHGSGAEVFTPEVSVSSCLVLGLSSFPLNFTISFYMEVWGGIQRIPQVPGSVGVAVVLCVPFLLVISINNSSQETNSFGCGSHGIRASQWPCGSLSFQFSGTIVRSLGWSVLTGESRTSKPVRCKHGFWL